MNSRKEYWENYVTYWHNKLKESNDSGIISADKAPDDMLVRELIGRLNMRPDDIFLDYGCASCRVYPYMCEKDVKHYFGVDISENALRIAIDKYPELKDMLRTTEGNDIPFEDDFFDKIFCLGTFDACPQEDIIGEIIRVLKPGGKALITGKNNNYHDDDYAALHAERRARENGHPNFFSDVRSIMEQLAQKGVLICDKGFSSYRGDFAQGKFRELPPECFYEFYIVIERTEDTCLSPFTTFSSEYSLTYKRNAVE